MKATLFLHMLPVLLTFMHGTSNSISAQTLNAKQYPWAWLHFERPALKVPIISPDACSRFFCPMRHELVSWEERETFNPAATVKGDSIVVLYRAEDNSHKGIGSRTSRLGYAASTDGIHFIRRSTPVFYPDNDAQAPFEQVVKTLV